MAPDGGTGRLIQNLGDWNGEPVALSGVVGGPDQPSTLLVRFYLQTAADLSLAVDRSRPRLTRFVDITLQRADNSLVELATTGTTRLTPGSYDLAIASLDWRVSPWAFSISARLLGSLRLRSSSAPGLRVQWSIKRLELRLRSEPALHAKAATILRLEARMSAAPALRGGLVAVPGYKPPSAGLISHAWVARTPTSIKVGSGDGTAWDARTGLPIEPDGYIDTPLTAGDYTSGYGRLIFSRESPAYYGTNPGIGPVPTDVTGPASPDYPGLSFLELISGAYRRDVVFSLPAGDDQQVLVQLREVLRWGNDILRDLPPPGTVYLAENRLARSASRRSFAYWLVGRTTVRSLQLIPTELVNRINSLLPPLASYLVTLNLRVPGSAPTQARVPCLVPSFIASETLPGPGDALFLSPPEAPFSNLPLSYGLTNSLRADRDFFSPAIYDTLAAGAALFSLPGYDPQDYVFVAAQLPSLPAGLLQYSPWYRSGAWAEGVTSDEIYQSNAGSPLRYGRWDGVAPSDAGLAVSPTSLSWTLIEQGLTLSSGRLNRPDEPRAMVAVDWGRPIEARIQLLELGFLSTDIEPAIPADPREARLQVRMSARPGIRARISYGTALVSGRMRLAPGLARLSLKTLQGRLRTNPGLNRLGLTSGP